MNIPFVDLKSQYRDIQDEIDAAIADVLTRCEFVGGRPIETFEEAFAAYCCSKHCVGVGNGTDALSIALRTLRVGPGDEVITAANSFIATSEAITQAGARVIFVDINPQTFNIDIHKIEEKITPRTKAIIPVHLYGQPADMDPILELASKNNLKVIEDAAQAHGARYKGHRVGTLGDMGCFSFYPGKNLGAYGDGGAIVTNDVELANSARMIANHGRIDKYDHACEGVNSRLDGLQAAILDVKLKHLPAWTKRRREIAYQYNELLRDAGLATPVELDGVESVYHLYVVRINTDLRSKLQSYLTAKGIHTGIHYPIALPNLKAYAYLNHRENEFPEATKASKEILSLPIFPELEEAQIKYIVECIKEFFVSLAGGHTFRSPACKESALDISKGLPVVSSPVPMGGLPGLEMAATECTPLTQEAKQ
jgi:dTDP-4-amino-4,6-dideoxygalactose transaminase